MELKLVRLEKEDYPAFKKMFQDAFQKGYEDHYGKSKELILPEKDIDWSLNTKGAESFKAVLNNEMVGGVIVQINENNINELHLLCVKNGAQSKGIGFEIWKQIEEKYPNTIKWHTCTPYFETRNIYFYVNKCGFHITKFENDREEFPSDFVGDGGEGMFKFEKVMK